MSRKRLDPQREARMRRVGEIVGHDFKNLAIINRALSHASLGNEGLPDYERLEFLGDAVLGFLVAESLYKREPEIPEGELTSRRSMLVSRRPLSIVATELDLGSYILVGRGLTDESLRSPRILADLVEAVLAAIYLDGGLHAARRFVQTFVLDRFKNDPELRGTTDAKTRLNQWAQSHDLGSPIYEIIETTGPDHDPTFRVAVTLAGLTCRSDEVKSKQTGEQEVAAECFAILSRAADEAAAKAGVDPAGTVDERRQPGENGGQQGEEGRQQGEEGRQQGENGRQPRGDGPQSEDGADDDIQLVWDET